MIGCAITVIVGFPEKKQPDPGNPGGLPGSSWSGAQFALDGFPDGPIYFSLDRGEASSIQRSVRSWYIISMATGWIPWTHGWWAITALL